ncbi:MAG: nitrophenyl compound nitroreductase subunit ArsF family protein [bacterium]
MLKKIFSILLLLFLALNLAGCSQQISIAENEASVDNNISKDYPMSSAEQIADRLEVYYFHRTARCYSCKTIGQYVREIIEEKYEIQTNSGIIDFREINVDLAENKQLVKKYQASGSSLFINRIINDQDNIEQDANVWRLLKDETKFKSYLESKINSYLGL